MTTRFRVVPAAYVFLRRSDAGDAAADAGAGDTAGSVLLQLRRGTGYMDGHWAAGAAGHVEAGESVYAAACREVLEELGVVIDPADLVPLTVMHRTQAEHRSVDERVDFFFGCDRWTGEPRLVEPDKAAELRWCPLDALPAPVVPHELLVLDALLAGDPVPILAVGF